MSDKQLTTAERAVYNALRARGVSHEDALADALDGVGLEAARELGPGRHAEPDPEPDQTYEEWLSGRIGDGRAGLGDVLIRFGEWLDREGLVRADDPGGQDEPRTFNQLVDQFLDEEREREWEQG